MENYLVTQSKIEQLSKLGIVACWSDSHNSAITEVNEESSKVCDECEIVTITQND